jgi:hypothetical protein
VQRLRAGRSGRLGAGLPRSAPDCGFLGMGKPFGRPLSEATSSIKRTHRPCVIRSCALDRRGGVVSDMRDRDAPHSGRKSTRRRSLVVAGSVVFGLMVFWVAAPVAAQGTRGATTASRVLSRASIASRPALKANRGQLAAELKALARRKALLRSAGAVRERVLSRYRFRGLSSAAAIRLAEQRFPSVIAAPAWRGLRLPAGSRVSRYLGSSEAIVRSADGHGSLAISTGPLVGATSRGRRRAPLDLALSSLAGGFVPRSSSTRLRFPGLSSGMVTVGAGANGFRVSLVGAAAHRGVVENGHVAYGNVYRATDAFLQAIPAGAGGAELAYQLRAPTSPDDAHVSGLAVCRSGETLAVAGAREPG